MLGFACVAIGAPCRALFFELSSFPHWREVVEFASIALRQKAMPGASFPLLTPGIALQLAARSRQLLRIILTRRTAQKSEIRKTYGVIRDATATKPHGAFRDIPHARTGQTPYIQHHHSGAVIAPHN